MLDLKSDYDYYQGFIYNEMKLVKKKANVIKDCLLIKKFISILKLN